MVTDRNVLRWLASVARLEEGGLSGWCESPDWFRLILVDRGRASAGCYDFQALAKIAGTASWPPSYQDRSAST